MGPTWGPPGSCRPQMGPMLAPWTFLSGWFINWTEDVTGTRNRGTEHLENVSRKFVCFLQWNFTGIISDGYVVIGGLGAEPLSEPMLTKFCDVSYGHGELINTSAHALSNVNRTDVHTYPYLGNDKYKLTTRQIWKHYCESGPQV